MTLLVWLSFVLFSTKNCLDFWDHHTPFTSFIVGCTGVSDNEPVQAMTAWSTAAARETMARLSEQVAIFAQRGGESRGGTRFSAPMVFPLAGPPLLNPHPRVS